MSDFVFGWKALLNGVWGDAVIVYCTCLYDAGKACGCVKVCE